MRPIKSVLFSAFSVLNEKHRCPLVKGTLVFVFTRLLDGFLPRQSSRFRNESHQLLVVNPAAQPRASVFILLPFLSNTIL